MKKLLKSEICESREQCTGPTDMLKSQILRLLFMNSIWIVAITVLFAHKTCEKRKKKKSKTRKHDIETCIQKNANSYELDFLFSISRKILSLSF